MKKLINARRALKHKFQTGQKVFAGWTSFGHTAIAEIFSRIGMDFVGIDLEHTTISLTQAEHLIVACQEKGKLCLPRIASHNPEMARRLLDAGADGLIVPQVSKAQDVKNIIDWMRYPPQGKRGFGVARAQGYGFDYDEYVNTWNENALLIVQIETIEGAKNIDEIIAFDEVDAVMIGPYDMSGSLGVPGQLQHPKVLAAGQSVLDACLRRKKSCGIQLVDPNQTNLQEAFSRGYNFIVLSSDLFALWKWGEKMQALLQTLYCDA